MLLFCLHATSVLVPDHCGAGYADQCQVVAGLRGALCFEGLAKRAQRRALGSAVFQRAINIQCWADHDSSPSCAFSLYARTCHAFTRVACHTVIVLITSWQDVLLQPGCCLAAMEQLSTCVRSAVLIESFAASHAAIMAIVHSCCLTQRRPHAIRAVLQIRCIRLASLHHCWLKPQQAGHARSCEDGLDHQI